MDQAAVAAEHSCEQMSWDSGWEFGGIILTKDGKYYFTPAQTSKLPSHLDLRVSYTTDYKFVGIYHTHPGSHEMDRWFSTADTQAALSQHVASYIGIQYERGLIRRFTPGQTHVVINYQGEHIARGDVVPE
jgi:hypothetical protein